jgi:hypothetical protein
VQRLRLPPSLPSQLLQSSPSGPASTFKHSHRGRALINVYAGRASSDLINPGTGGAVLHVAACYIPPQGSVIHRRISASSPRHGTPCSSTLPSTPRSQVTPSCSWVTSMPRQGDCQNQQASQSCSMPCQTYQSWLSTCSMILPARKQTDTSTAMPLASSFWPFWQPMLCVSSINGRVTGANDGYTCFSSSGAPGRAPPRPSTVDYAAGSIDLLGSVQAMNIHDTAESDHTCMLSISLH